MRTACISFILLVFVIAVRVAPGSPVRGVIYSTTKCPGAFIVSRVICVRCLIVAAGCRLKAKR